MLFALGTGTAARSVEIELVDVAPDRVERQRAYSSGATPLPGTPDLGRLDERLAAKGLRKGSFVFVRIFKASSELELWMRKDDTYVLLDTYPICHWTGTLGPKLREGDKQSPEGFYSVSSAQLRAGGRWPRAINLGYPNAYDQANRRTGSYILMHGGCSSIGCFAMTEPVQDEIHRLAGAALEAGQGRIQVHVFPFRMTEEAMSVFADHRWAEFWRDLKQGFDAFERTRVPPQIALCGRRYHVSDNEAVATTRGPALPSLQRSSAASPDSDYACVTEPQLEDGSATIARSDSEPSRSTPRSRRRQGLHRTTRSVVGPLQKGSATARTERESRHDGLGERIDQDGPRLMLSGS